MLCVYIYVKIVIVEFQVNGFGEFGIVVGQYYYIFICFLVSVLGVYDEDVVDGYVGDGVDVFVFDGSGVFDKVWQVFG